jgi:hypothetical protein
MHQDSIHDLPIYIERSFLNLLLRIKKSMGELFYLDIMHQDTIPEHSNMHQEVMHLDTIPDPPICI